MTELSYAAGETTTPLLDETIGANLARTVAQWPDREALVEVASGRRWTWRELDHAVDQVARGLVAAGIAAGDRIGMWAPNCAEWTITQFAAARAGAVLVNVNPSYRTHELAYAVNQSGLRLLLTVTGFKTSDYRGMVEEVTAAGEVPGLERTVYVDTDDWQELVAGGGGLPADALTERERGLRPTDPINIQYTCGTTGFPKGATLSHRNILNNGFFVDRAARLHRAGPALHPGALLPLLRHGDGQPRLRHPRRHDGHPGAGLRPVDHAAVPSRTSVAPLLYGVPDDVHRDAERPRLRVLRPQHACAPGSWPARSARSR